MNAKARARRINAAAAQTVPPDAVRAPPRHPTPPFQHKVWLKSGAEMTFLYGNHITKAGLGRITEGVPQYAGVVV